MHAMNAKRLGGVAVGILAWGLGAWASGADQPGVYFKGDLSFVQTVGNSAAGTLGAKANLTKNWLRTSFVVNGGGIRTQTRETTRLAIGTSVENAQLYEETVTKTSAENFFTDAQLSYRLTESVYWLVGAGFMRDSPAGIKSRLTELAGLGVNMSTRPELEFKLLAAGTFTQENTTVTDASAKDSYPGVRVAYGYKQKVSDSATLTHNLTFDLPFSPSDNFRVDGQAGLEVSMTRSGSLALKAAARVLYDNVPALEELALLRPDLTNTGIKVVTPLKKVDSQFTVSLVVNLSRKGGMTSQRGR